MSSDSTFCVPLTDDYTRRRFFRKETSLVGCLIHRLGESTPFLSPPTLGGLLGKKAKENRCQAILEGWPILIIIMMASDLGL